MKEASDGAADEGAVQRAFAELLAGYGKRLEWKLVPEYPYKKVRVDGALIQSSAAIFSL